MAVTEKQMANLKPVTKRTKSEAREISRKGGKASGVARNKRKTLGEELLAILMTKMDDKTMQEHMCLSMVQKAVSEGSVAHFSAIRDTIGEKPAEKVEQQVNVAFILNRLRGRAATKSRAASKRKGGTNA